MSCVPRGAASLLLVRVAAGELGTGPAVPSAPGAAPARCGQTHATPGLSRTNSYVGFFPVFIVGLLLDAALAAAAPALLILPDAD